MADCTQGLCNRDAAFEVACETLPSGFDKPGEELMEDDGNCEHSQVNIICYINGAVSILMVIIYRMRLFWPHKVREARKFCLLGRYPCQNKPVYLDQTI